MKCGKWVNINGHVYNLEYLQEFHWHDGAIYLQLLGRQVPEIIPDHDASIFKRLYGIVS